MSGEAGEQDFLGAAAAFVFLFSLLMFINRSQEAGINVATGVMLALAVAAGIGFFLRERSTLQPMLDMGLFHNLTFAFGSLSALLNYMAQYVVIFLTPFYLHRVLDLSPNKVGLIMTCFPLAVMIVGPFSGWLSDRIGSRWLSSLGALICAAATALLSKMHVSATGIDISLSLLLFGIGTGLFQSPNTSAAMGGLPRPHLGVASAVLANVRNVGMVMGVALAGLVLHAYVSDEILDQHHLDPSQAWLFMQGLAHAFAAGALISVCTAVTSLVKKSKSTGNSLAAQ
jgi:MFS family permease